MYKIRVFTYPRIATPASKKMEIKHPVLPGLYRVGAYLSTYLFTTFYTNKAPNFPGAGVDTIHSIYIYIVQEIKGWVVAHIAVADELWLQVESRLGILYIGGVLSRKRYFISPTVVGMYVHTSLRGVRYMRPPMKQSTSLQRVMKFKGLG